MTCHDCCHVSRHVMTPVMIEDRQFSHDYCQCWQEKNRHCWHACIFYVSRDELWCLRQLSQHQSIRMLTPTPMRPQRLQLPHVFKQQWMWVTATGSALTCPCCMVVESHHENESKGFLDSILDTSETHIDIYACMDTYIHTRILQLINHILNADHVTFCFKIYVAGVHGLNMVQQWRQLGNDCRLLLNPWLF